MPAARSGQRPVLTGALIVIAALVVTAVISCAAAVLIDADERAAGR